MRLRNVLLIIVLTVFFSTFAGCVNPLNDDPLDYDKINANDPVNNGENVDPSQFITEEAAIEAALAHSGMSEADIMITRVDLDMEDGRYEYDVEFLANGFEYDYEIDALTGNVLSYDVEREVMPSPVEGSEYITPEEALAIALEHAGVSESDAREIDVDLNEDDAIVEYEVDFKTANEEYNYDISAVTGEILSYHVELDDGRPNPKPTPGQEYITREAALEIALEHAQITMSEASNIRVEFGMDDGRAEYEVDFNANGLEYDYEIDAVTGVIISVDIDDERPRSTDAPIASPGPDPTAGSEYITRDEALTIALDHANVSREDATRIKVQFGYDDGRAEYEVDFKAGGREYDYEIDAITGAVLSVDVDDDAPRPTQNPTTSPAPDPTQGTEYITEEEALTIALNHAGVSRDDATNIRVRFGYDDRRAEYDVEFRANGYEYEYEIDAITGAIISFDRDDGPRPTQSPVISPTPNPTPKPTPTPGNNGYITRDEALAIALDHADVLRSEAYDIEVEFDYDDGRAEYEVEFKANRLEYNYEIDAVTGAIISFDVDDDDYEEAPGPKACILRKNAVKI